MTRLRRVLAGLGGGCTTPVAAYASWGDGTLVLRGKVCSSDGAEQVDVSGTARAADVEAACAAGLALAQEALAQGARKLLGPAA